MCVLISRGAVPLPVLVKRPLSTSSILCCVDDAKRLNGLKSRLSLSVGVSVIMNQLFEKCFVAALEETVQLLLSEIQL